MFTASNRLYGHTADRMHLLLMVDHPLNDLLESLSETLAELRAGQGGQRLEW